MIDMIAKIISIDEKTNTSIVEYKSGEDTMELNVPLGIGMLEEAVMLHAPAEHFQQLVAARTSGRDLSSYIGHEIFLSVDPGAKPAPIATLAKTGTVLS